MRVSALVRELGFRGATRLFPPTQKQRPLETDDTVHFWPGAISGKNNRARKITWLTPSDCELERPKTCKSTQKTLSAAALLYPHSKEHQFYYKPVIFKDNILRKIRPFRIKLGVNFLKTLFYFEFSNIINKYFNPFSQ